jgi:peptide/nickel transport system substrate-binding protein
MSSEFEGYWLDPRDKSFGANAKYYMHDLAEAKKLLAAAGYPNGFDVEQTFTTSIGNENQREILAQFAREAGFRINATPVDITTKYTPMRDSKGQFEGLLVKSGGDVADPIAEMAYHYSLKAGVNFYGFNANGKSAPTGDPFVESLITKGMAEFEPEKRREIAIEMQKYLAEQMYLVMYPGGSSGFAIAWPCLKNFGVYTGPSDQVPTYWWVDETEAPIKKA